MEKELRVIQAETMGGNGKDEAHQKVVGIGIVYDQWTEIFPGYKERIVRGAVRPDSVVKSFVNHEPGFVLATTKSDPALELNETAKGMEYTAPIPPTSYGHDLMVNLERGNIAGSSFAFSVPKDGHKTWDEDGMFYREIRNLVLYEIGPVTDPAYVQTSADLRVADSVMNEYQEYRNARSQEAVADDISKQRKAAQEGAERERELQLIEYEVN